MSVGGRRILDRVADALRPVTTELVLISNTPDAANWLPGVRAVADVRPERGSLVALHTALTVAGDTVLVVAWDMPFVSTAVLRGIRDRSTQAAFAAIAESATGLEPFCAAYTTTCLPLLDEALDRGDLRLRAFLGRLPSIELLSLSDVFAVGDPARLFFNVNDPADLAIAEQLAGSG